jgi:hypothetical protein
MDKYVCVALDARKERGEYKDADGDFVRATNCVTVTASGSVCVVSAGGKALGPYSGPGPGMEKWLAMNLKTWEALPASERLPGAIKLPATIEVDPKRAALSLPAGALILRVFNRHLGWNEVGSLRYVVAEDYLPGSNTASVERFGMAQNDFMWIPKNEWQALVPAEAKVGMRQSVPTSLALRLFRHHLDPCRGFSEGAAFTSSRSDAGRLTLTVQAVDGAKLTLRLEGSAALRQPGRDAMASYDAALLGVLEYDRTSKTFTRFDLLALGTASGLPTDANGVVTPRRGPYPLGIAFELVANPTPADQLHPRGARDGVAAYLTPKDR